MDIATMNRRNFLRLMGIGGATAGAASLVGCAAPKQKSQDGSAPNGEAAENWRDAPKLVSETDIAETIEIDVIVAGGGIAGCCTGASAAENGLNVAVFEKAEQPRMTGLDFGSVNPAIAKEAGLTVDDQGIYRIVRDWTHMAANRMRADIARKFCIESGSAIDWLAEKATARGCDVVLSAMRSNSDTYYNYIHTVEFQNGPLYDVASGAYSVNDAIAALRECLEEHGGQYLTKTEVVQLDYSDSGVTGVVVKNDDGKYIRYKASKGVVLCTGDFGANEQMMKDLTCFDFDSYDSDGYVNYSTGDGFGHRLGLAAGAVFQQGPQPTMMLPNTYPYFYLRVNDRGERFCNEDCDSVNMCINQLQQHEAKSWAIFDSKWPTEIPASLEYSGGMSWDQDFRNLGTPWSEEVEQAMLDFEAEEGALFMADTIDELAEKIGVDAASLKKTVERYNELTASGADEDFGKRSELMTSIEQGPFYALRQVTLMCVTVGGLQVNTNSQCLDETGAPIKGLFAVGNTAGGMFGVDYNEAPVPGVSLGRCCTFGKLLGEHLATI